MKKEFLEQSILGTMLEENTKIMTALEQTQLQGELFDTANRITRKKRTPPKEMDILELIVAKNRNGPTGTAYSLYNRITGQIREQAQVAQ